jgi:DNA-binding beta-propeller fold protein YncE
MGDWRFRSKVMTGMRLLALTAVAGCSHGQASAPAQRLYAAIPEVAEVAVYPVTASGSQQPLATIKEAPPDKPIDVSVDLSGEVFVANENGNVRGYNGRDNHYQLARTIAGPHTGVEHPSAIVAEMAGSFYVADSGSTSTKPRVEWFTAGLHGNVVANRIISGSRTGIAAPRGLAVDGSGRLFVADEGANKILVFDPDAEGNVAPIAVLEGLKSPQHVFVDELLNVYVSSSGNNSISVFMTDGPQSWSRSATITGAALRDPQGVAVDGRGRIAVAETGGILFFAPDSNGPQLPVADLGGPQPMNPAGIFIR